MKRILKTAREEAALMDAAVLAGHFPESVDRIIEKKEREYWTFR